MELKDQVAIVTGAGRGIGTAIALRFAREGARIVLNYFSSGEEAKNIVSEIKEMGGSFISVKADGSDPSEVEKLIITAVSAYGRIDKLVNNAGMGPGPIAVERNLNRVLGFRKKAAAVVPLQRCGEVEDVDGGELAQLCGTSTEELI